MSSSSRLKDIGIDLTLFQGKANVIIVDWRDGAANWNYCQSAANTRLVGQQIGKLVRKLEGHYKANIAERTHIVGYSLGAHVAGNAGMYIRRNPSQVWV